MIRWRGFEPEPALAACPGAWLLAVALALAHLVVCRATYARLYAGYFAFPLAPWKLASFLLALAIVTVIAPYTGDISVDTPLMSLLSNLSAPWVLGVLYRRSAPRTRERTNEPRLSRRTKRSEMRGPEALPPAAEGTVAPVLRQIHGEESPIRMRLF
jgi:hypothetical protein